MVVQNAFSMGVDVAGVDRLVLMHKGQPDPAAPDLVRRAIRSMDGVTHVGYSTGSAARIRTGDQFAVHGRGRRLLPAVPGGEDSRRADEGLARGSQGIIVGQDDGGEVRLEDWRQGPYPGDDSGSPSRHHLFYNVDGIYDGEKDSHTPPSSSTTKYLDENRRGAYGQWLVRASIADPSRSAEIASRLTRSRQFVLLKRTSTEKAFLRASSTGRQHQGDHRLGFLPRSCHALPAGARQHHGAVRPRADQRAGRPQDARVLEQPRLGLVLAESIFLALLGGASDCRTYFAVQGQLQQLVSLPSSSCETATFVIGVALCCTLGVVPEHGLRPPRCGCASPCLRRT